MEKENKIEVIKRDTVIDWHYSTDTVWLAKTIYKDIYHYDTIHIEDKVYIEDTLHNYNFDEPNYTLNINAVRLDNYKLDIHSRDTITLTETVYQTIYRQKRNNFTLGLSVGYGYGVKSRDLQPFVGITATYNILGK